MKKLLIFLLVLFMVIGVFNLAYGGQKNVPSFIKVGKSYTFLMPGLGGTVVTVTKIDSATGYVEATSTDKRGVPKMWYNIKSLVGIEEK